MTALWSVATAYFVMASTFSFRVSNSRDLTALALYGAVGIALGKTTPISQGRIRSEPKAQVKPPVVLVDLKTVLAEMFPHRS